MIKLAFKLALLAMVVNACYRIGSEYVTFIRFRDGVRSAAIYRATTNEDLRARIAVLAAEYDVPLAPDDVTIERESRLVTVNAKYQKPIVVLPRYEVQWPFSISLEVQTSIEERLPGAPPLR